MKNVFKKAHEITKKILRKGDSYRETFRLALIFVYSELKKGVKEMVELKGTEKQIAWANDIKKVVLECANKRVSVAQESYNQKQNKRRTRVLEESKNLLTRLENEDSSKFFIDNFASVLKEKLLAAEILINGVYNRFDWCVDRI